MSLYAATRSFTALRAAHRLLVPGSFGRVLAARKASFSQLKGHSPSHLATGKMEVEKVGTVVVIRMKGGENRITYDFIADFHQALDKAEAYEDATAVVTVGEGKFYSVGLDFGLLASAQSMSYMSEVQKLLRRLLTFPTVTVAALNGHAFAAGAFIAMSHDHMIMRTGKGWFCLPEINLKFTFIVGFMELIKARIPQSEHIRCIVLGQRYTAEQAKAAGIVQELSSPEKLMESAIAAAHRLAGSDPPLDRKTLSALKDDLHHDVCRALSEPARFYSHL